MKLYIVPGSGNCRRVQAVIAHLDLEIEIRPLDFFAGDLETPAFLAINPNGMVPALEDGDFKLWESVAIMQYLADKAGDTPLYPRDPVKRADIQRWLAWGLAHFGKANEVVQLERFLKPAFLNEPANDTVAEYFAAEIHRFAQVLGPHLEQRAFVTGDNVTLADFALAHTSAFWTAAGIALDECPVLSGWLERLNQIPAWRDTAPPPMEEMGRTRVA